LSTLKREIFLTSATAGKTLQTRLKFRFIWYQWSIMLYFYREQMILTFPKFKMDNPAPTIDFQNNTFFVTSNTN